jgi:hypothetical protein
MSLRIILALAAVTLVTTQALHATVTLQFSQSGVARATGFADHLGNPTNGMAWGIIVDGSGNGFQAGTYDVFSSSTSGFLSVGGLQTDDYFVTSGLFTSALSATGTDPGGDGGITSISNIFSSYPSGIGSGDAFRLVWFESTPAEGSYYGTFGDPSFTLPADGNTTSYASVFTGSTSDPAKAAAHQFGTSVIPEPSRMLLLGMALTGLLFRRRR